MKLEICEYEVKTEKWIYYITRCKQRNGEYLWKVVEDLAFTLSRDLKWIYEPQPSSRTDDYIMACRFPLDVALELLEKYEESVK